MVKTLVRSTSEPWNKGTKKVPRLRCWKDEGRKYIRGAPKAPAPRDIWAPQKKNKKWFKTWFLNS
jgi:hypothetical protein